MGCWSFSLNSDFDICAFADELIVTFLAFKAAYVFYGHTIHFASLHIVMELLVNAVKFISGAVSGIKVHLGLAVTVNTPTHAQLSHLLYFVHFLDITVAGLAGYITYPYVLGVVKVNVVGQVMDLYPFR